MHANLQALRERNLRQKLVQLEAEILAQALAMLQPAINPEPDVVDTRTFQQREEQATTTHALLMSNFRWDFERSMRYF
jgi:hypothetical protein